MVTVKGNLALSAKAVDLTHTLENVTVAGKVTTNNNIVFKDCESIGTVAAKGTVVVSGKKTTAVSIDAKAKVGSGTSSFENLTVEKTLKVAHDFTAKNCEIAGAVTASAGNAALTDCTLGNKLTVSKGILTVNGNVKVANAITCAELNSTDSAVFTAMSFAVTKNGVSADSGEITLKLIDKNGTAVSPKPDKKGVITVSKKFKDSKTKAKEFDVPALKFNNGGTICPLKCVSGKLVVSA